MTSPASHTHRSPIRTSLIGVGVILLVLLLLAGAGFAYLRYAIDSQIRHIEVTATASAPQAQLQSTPQSDDSQSVAHSNALNFLILGSDSRSSGGDPRDWRAGAQRSDVMMLLQLNGDRTQMSVMSLPRDLWVPIPGYGHAKINAAYSYGGADLAIQTVQNLVGAPIHHFAVVDFESFAQMTDQLGGVTIETTSGTRHLNGEQALTFVRERKSLPSGDLDRVRRQQAWIDAILSSVFEQGALTDPGKMSGLLQALLSHSAVDEGLTFDSMMALAVESRNIRRSGITFFTAPVNGTGSSFDGQSIVVLNEEAMSSLAQAWAQDKVKDWVQSSETVRVLDSDPVY